MKFFCDCKDHDHVKRLYRELAKCLHPDRGGSKELMCELQRQYEGWTPEQTNNPYVHVSNNTVFFGHMRMGYNQAQGFELQALRRENETLKATIKNFTTVNRADDGLKYKLMKSTLENQTLKDELAINNKKLFDLSEALRQARKLIDELNAKLADKTRGLLDLQDAYDDLATRFETLRNNQGVWGKLKHLYKRMRGRV